MFGSSSPLSSLIKGGGLVNESAGRADLQSDYFDSKQSGKLVDLRLTCHPSPSLTTFDCMSSEVKRLLLDLNTYGGTDQLGMFPPFLKITAEVSAPRLSVVFLRVVLLGSFLAC